MRYLLIAGFTALTIFGQQPAPDNTKANERDKDRGNVTADQQESGKGDTKILAEIRRGVVNDKTLSTYAHNVKIVVQNGSVVLRGPVRTQAEKETVGRIAGTFVGAGRVTNSLEIAPDKDKDSK